MSSEIDTLDLLSAKARLEARKSLWAYRQHIHPGLTTGWFPQALSNGLQEFYEDYEAGRKPIYVLCTPPQHGKSAAVTDLIGWMSGQNPHLRTVFASYSGRLGIRTNLSLQRKYDTNVYSDTFPETNINPNATGATSSRARRNSELLEYSGTDGSFRNTTVGGPITGESLDIGVIDDPIKGRAEARSQTTRDKTWDWLTDDVISRFSEYAGLLLVMTRWHLDDPAGRLLQENSDVRVLSYPALAEPGAHLTPTDQREPGSYEPLFPEFKSREFLEKRRGERVESSWQSIYQQNPIVAGGGLFPIEMIKVLDHEPELTHEPMVRYWDKAGSDDTGAYTSGVLMAKKKDGAFIVLDVVRGQWNAHKREQIIRQTAEIDGHAVKVRYEQEPGSGGKESAENTLKNLAGFDAQADRVSGSKENRAEPYAAQVQGGNIYLVRGHWNRDFINEHESFPNGAYADQVDAVAGAFNRLNSGTDHAALWANLL